MSYQIFYGKQFVKLERNNSYIPMVLSGSNNCTFHHNGKEIRERDWGCLDYYIKTYKGKKFFATKEEILDSIDKWIDEKVQYGLNSEWENDNEEQIKEKFGYYASFSFSGSTTRNSTAKRFKNFFANGIKNAMTIGELFEKSITMRFSTFRWSGYEFSMPIPEFKVIDSEDAFFEEYEKLTKWQNECVVTEGDKKFKPSLYLSYNQDFDYILNVTKVKREKKLAHYKKYSKFYVLRHKQTGRYFAKKIKWGYRYTYDVSYYNKAFASFKTATNYLKKYFSDAEWEVHEINKEREIKCV